MTTIAERWRDGARARRRGVRARGADAERGDDRRGVEDAPGERGARGSGGRRDRFRRELRAGARGQARRVRRDVALALHRPAAAQQGQARRRPGRARARGRLGRARGRARQARAAACSRSCIAVNVAGEATQGRRRADGGAGALARAIAAVAERAARRPDDDAAARRSESAGRTSRRCARCAIGSPASSAAPLPVLSMGMSGDFEVAIACGATHVRIGTAIFGARASLAGA